jgi:hypothetical protein
MFVSNTGTFHIGTLCFAKRFSNAGVMGILRSLIDDVGDAACEQEPIRLSELETNHIVAFEFIKQYYLPIKDCWMGGYRPTDFVRRTYLNVVYPYKKNRPFNTSRGTPQTIALKV